MNIVNAPDFDLTKAADVIGRDTALVVSLLKMVNRMSKNKNKRILSLLVFYVFVTFIFVSALSIFLINAKSEKKELRNQGIEAFNSGDYEQAIDLFHRKRRRIWLFYFLAIIIECLCMRGQTWHMYLAVVLMNSAILFLLLFLLYQLKNRSEFSSFSYFTEGGYLIAATLTLFFSVLVMGKYAQLPFTCDDIEDFPQKVVETQVDKLTQVKDFFKGTWKDVKEVFSSEEDMPQKPDKNLKDFMYVKNDT